MSLLDDAGIFSSEDGHEQQKLLGGINGYRILGAQPTITNGRPSTGVPFVPPLLLPPSRPLAFPSSRPSTVRIPSRPSTVWPRRYATINGGSLSSRPSTSLNPIAPHRSGGNQTVRSHRSASQRNASIRTNGALTARPTANSRLSVPSRSPPDSRPWEEAAPSAAAAVLASPPDATANGATRRLKGFVDNSDAFAEVLADARENALFDDSEVPAAGKAEGATSLRMDGAAELLLARRFMPNIPTPVAAQETPRSVTQQPTARLDPLSGSLRGCAPSWWSMPAPFVKAADAFDQHHKMQHKRAERVLQHWVMDQHSERKNDACSEAIWELRSTKFVPRVPLVAQAPVRKRAARERVKQDKFESIWVGRPKWCDAKALLDTEQVEWLKLNLDWTRALACGLQGFVLKNDDDGDVDADGDGVFDELGEVLHVAWEHRGAYFRLFDHYASVGGDSMGSISVNEWNFFVGDMDLADAKSKFCKKADLERLFVAVDGASGGRKRDKVLSRHEFLNCLVRVAVEKYVRPKVILDVSDAYRHLCEEVLGPHVNSAFFEHPNVFREAYCYKREVDKALKRYESSLRAIFQGISRVPRAMKAKSLGPLLNLADWKQFIKKLGLISVDLTERDCNLCFVHSRMAVIDGESELGRLKEAAIPFEGFCEALVRLALLKTLPTLKELERGAPEFLAPKAPCAHAGEFMARMREGVPDDLRRYLETYANPWGTAPRQPPEMCVEALLAFIMYSMEIMVSSDKGGRGFSANLQITQEEMKNWCERFWEVKEERMNTSLD